MSIRICAQILTYFDHFTELVDFDLFKFYQRIFNELSLIALARCQDNVQVLDRDLDRSGL